MAACKIARTILRCEGKIYTNEYPLLLDDALSLRDCTVQSFITDTQPGEGDMHDGIRDISKQTEVFGAY